MPDCGYCGLALPPTGADPRGTELAWWWEDDEIVCPDCGATNTIGAEDEYAYVAYWTCRHGVGEDDPACIACEAAERYESEASSG